jgi:hypothetical protein
MSWRTYLAWNRACLLNAWRATRNFFGRGWRGVLKIVAPGLATTLGLCISSSGTDVPPDVALASVTGVSVTAAWVLIVLSWNFGLAPYRLWRAARARITQLQMANGRRIDRQVIAQELELRIREGVALMNTGSPSQRQLSQWYQRVLRVVSRASDRERALLETAGPAPGTRGGALEMLILSNRIEKLRLILDRQSGARTPRKRRAPTPRPGFPSTRSQGAGLVRPAVLSGRGALR